MSILKNANILQNFKIICTDSGNVPAQITSVPTLIVQQIDRPLVGQDAFNWANGLIQIKAGTIQQNENKKIFLMQQLQKMNKTKDDLNGTNLTNNTFTAIGDNLQDDPENICLNPTDKTTFIYTAPELDKIDEMEQEKAIKQALVERDKQDAEYKEYLKKFQ